jgi:hypothetical protein
VSGAHSTDCEDIWDDLIDLHPTDQGGWVVVLRAYVDASDRKADGLISVAAHLIESGRVRRFKQEWRRVFGDASFSWAELVTRHGTFRSVYGREHDDEHRRLVTAGVKIIREYFIAASVVSCWRQDVENFGPTWVKGFGHAYSVAGHMAMAGMGDWAKRNNYKGGIAYFIEAGDQGQDHLEHLLSYASKSVEVRDLYQWASHTTTPKSASSPFHAPDMLAWEWGKFWLESVIRKKRPMRLSFVHLLVDRLDAHRFQFLAGEPLMRFFRQINELGVEQLQEDRAALASVESVDVSEAVRTSEQTEPVEDRK